MPARLPILAALVAMTGLAGAWMALQAPIRISGDAGDWRSVATGLRRSRPDGTLRGGARAVIHVRDIHGGLARLDLQLSAVPEAGPVQASVRTPGGVAFAGGLTDRVEVVPTFFPPGVPDAEVWLEATPSASSPAAVLRVHEIVLVRQASVGSWIGLLLPPLVGVTTLWLLWRREGQGAAVAAALVAAALVVGLWLAVLDPTAALRFRPAAREWLCLALLVALWGVAAWRPRFLAVPAVVATVGVLYLPSLSHGFVYDDFVFARPWSWREALSTLVGSWDPSGLSTDYFRPVASATLALDYKAWGPWPPGFHLTNLVLLSMVGCLVLRLFSRIAFSPRASLAGALAWLVHPLGATAAVWVNERTDSLATLFYVAALTLLLSAEVRPLAVLLLYLLALGSKELAVTWPLLAALTLALSGPWERRRERFKVIRLAALLTGAYVALWVSLFPGRIVGRLAEEQAAASLPAGAGWKAIPAFLATVFAPVDYVSWWQTSLGAAPLPWLCAGLLLPLLAWAATRRCGACGPGRTLLLGVLWPVVTALPMLGMSGLDVYGKGLLLCLGFGVVWGFLVRHVEHRSVAMAVALAILPAVWLGPRSRATTAAWGPGGFFWERNMRWTQGAKSWKAGLTPEMRELFREQMEAAARDERWVRSGR
jgi:hypothetical protein